MIIMDGKTLVTAKDHVAAEGAFDRNVRRIVQAGTVNLTDLTMDRLEETIAYDRRLREEVAAALGVPAELVGVEATLTRDLDRLHVRGTVTVDRPLDRVPVSLSHG